jgi:hypothetical protein
MNNLNQKCEQIREQFEYLTKKKVTLKIMKNGDEHKPTKLKKEESGVYVFLNEKDCFKVGKAGVKSKARWNSHHYNLDRKTPSTLAKSIYNHKGKFKKYFSENFHDEIDGLDENNIKDWIINNLTRIEFILNYDDKFELNLLEALVQFKLKPIFEGKINSN